MGEPLTDRLVRALPARPGTAAANWWCPTASPSILLPPYSPELNPAERIWHFLRSHWLSNRVFADLEDVIGACVDAWNRFVADPDLIASLCHVAWAIPPEPSG